MKRSKWPLVIGALVIGALAGMALAGRPETLPSVVIPASTVATASTTVADADPATTTSAAAASTTTVAVTTSTAASTSTSASAPLAPSTTGAASLRTANVVVVNATGTRGLASRAADTLLQAGWPPVVTDDARNKLSVSRVMYQPGFEVQARLAAQDLGLTVEVEPFVAGIATIEEATGDVMVYLGSDVNI